MGSLYIVLKTWAVVALWIFCDICRAQNGRDAGTPPPIGEHQLDWCTFNTTFANSNPQVCRDIRDQFSINNVVFADLQDCSKYYLCTGNKLHRRDCPDGTMFDHQYFYCVPPRTVRCLTTCEKSDTTATPRTTVTRGSWQTLPKFTRPTLPTTPTSGPITTSQSAVTTSDDTLPWDYCYQATPCRVGDQLPKLENGCKQYYKCEENQGETQWSVKTCRSRFKPMIFDPVSKECKEVDSVKCPDPALCPTTTVKSTYTSPQPTTTLDQTTTGSNIDIDYCHRNLPCRIGEKLPDPSNCSAYYICIERHDGPLDWKHQPCDPGGEARRHFDVNRLACILRDRAVCAECNGDATTTIIEGSTSAAVTTIPTTTEALPESTPCNRQLPCRLEEKLPDPENCTHYYQCVTVKGSLPPVTIWSNIRCISKIGHSLFDSESRDCMHVDDEPVCAESCFTTTTSVLSTEKKDTVTTVSPPQPTTDKVATTGTSAPTTSTTVMTSTTSDAPTTEDIVPSTATTTTSPPTTQASTTETVTSTPKSTTQETVVLTTDSGELTTESISTTSSMLITHGKDLVTTLVPDITSPTPVATTLVNVETPSKAPPSTPSKVETTAPDTTSTKAPTTSNPTIQAVTTPKVTTMEMATSTTPTDTPTTTTVVATTPTLVSTTGEIPSTQETTKTSDDLVKPGTTQHTERSTTAMSVTTASTTTTTEEASTTTTEVATTEAEVVVTTETAVVVTTTSEEDSPTTKEATTVDDELTTTPKITSEPTTTDVETTSTIPAAVTSSTVLESTTPFLSPSPSTVTTVASTAAITNTIPTTLTTTLSSTTPTTNYVQTTTKGTSTVPSTPFQVTTECNQGTTMPPAPQTSTPVKLLTSTQSPSFTTTLRTSSQHHSTTVNHFTTQVSKEDRSTTNLAIDEVTTEVTEKQSTLVTDKTFVSTSSPQPAVTASTSTTVPTTIVKTITSSRTSSMSPSISDGPALTTDDTKDKKTTTPPLMLYITNHNIQMTSSDALEQRPLEFSCTFTIAPSYIQRKRYEVSWYLDDLHIDPDVSSRISTRVTTQGNAYKHLLVFKSAKLYDSGKLRCDVKVLDFNKPSSSAEIDFGVLSLPQVSIHPLTVTTQPGKSVTFNCTYTMTKTSHPSSRDINLTVVWYKDNDAVNSDDEEITTIGKYSTLTLVPSDNATYSCSVQNDAGVGTSLYAMVSLLQSGDRACEAQVTNGLSWSLTKHGMTSVLDCPGKQKGFAYRLCGQEPIVNDDSSVEKESEDVDSRPIWGKPNFNRCIGNEFVELQNEMEKLEDGIGANSDSLRKIAQDLENLTTINLEMRQLSPGNLNTSVEIVTKVGEMHEWHDDMVLTKEEMQTVINTVSALISEDNYPSWRALSREDGGRSIGNILPLMDTFTEVAARDFPSNETFMSDNLLFQVEKFPKSSARTVSFPHTDPLPMAWMMSQNDAITIQKDTMNNLPQDLVEGELYSLSSVYYKDINSILPVAMIEHDDNNDDETEEHEKRDQGEEEEEIAAINSRVLSLTLHGLKQSVKLQPNVTINLTLDETYENHTAMCAFWNYSISNEIAEGKGGWDTSGCSVVQSTDQQVTCSCNHLTNFAVLMSPNPVDDGMHYFILSVISIVGCVISIGGMVLTILLYIAMWKNVKSHHAVVLINLCIALIIANILFIAGVDKVDIKMMCTVIAVLLHYFYLAAFFLMLVEGIELLLYTIYVFHVRRKRETASLIFLAWTLPAIIVGVSLGITKMEGYGNERFCWLDIESGLLWAFVGPVLAIILVNVIIAIIVLKRVATARVLGTMQRKKHKIRSALRNLLVIMPVMGLAWLFGVFTVNDDTTGKIFQYIFVVANSLQGIFIFIFHALCNKKKKYGNGSSTKTNRSRLKSASSDKSKKSKSSNNSSTPSSLLDEKSRLYNGDNTAGNRDSLPAYNYLFPESPNKRDSTGPQILGSSGVGYDNPTFSTFNTEGSSDGPSEAQKLSDLSAKADSTQELHYVEEVTYQLTPDTIGRAQLMPNINQNGNAVQIPKPASSPGRSPLTSTGSGNSTTSC